MTKKELQAELESLGIEGWNTATSKAELEALLAEEVETTVAAPEAPLQDLLDPDGNGLAIRILREYQEPDGDVAYYVDGGMEFAGRTRMVRVPGDAHNESRAKMIRAELAA